MESARSFFDTISSVYDQRTVGDWKSPSAVGAIAKPLIGSKTKLLDFGVGTGAVLTALDGSLMQANTFAVDVAAGMIAASRKKFPAVDIRQITTARDIRSFGWPQFELILSSGVFEYIERIDALLYALNGLLNKYGEIIFTYQPIVAHHPKQFDRASRVTWTTEFARSIGLNTSKNIETTEFRWHSHEIDEFCRTAGLKIIKHESFVAYYDLMIDKTISPRIYNLVRAKSSPP